MATEATNQPSNAPAPAEVPAGSRPDTAAPAGAPANPRSDTAAPADPTARAAQVEPAAPQPEPPAAGRAEVRELERQLEVARQKLLAAEERARENLDRWQRAQADLANYRRRAQFDREELEKFATANLVAALLPVLDSFDRAWQTLPGELRRLTWLSGVAMIHSQLRGTLERIGVIEIEAEGQPFDAALHEAIDRQEGDGPPYVAAVYQAGYKLHERVLRPALVKVGPRPEGQGSRVKGQEDTAGTPAAEPGPAATNSPSP